MARHYPSPEEREARYHREREKKIWDSLDTLIGSADIKSDPPTIPHEVQEAINRFMSQHPSVEITQDRLKVFQQLAEIAERAVKERKVNPNRPDSYLD